MQSIAVVEVPGTKHWLLSFLQYQVYIYCYIHCSCSIAKACSIVIKSSNTHDCLVAVIRGTRFFPVQLKRLPVFPRAVLGLRVWLALALCFSDPCNDSSM